jgi:predicted dienelactone hydrolase
MKKALVLIATLLAAAVLYIQFGNMPQPIASSTESGLRLAPGPYRVLTEEFTMVDASRSRTLNASIWRPGESPEAQPLVVYSHGFMSSREEVTHLAEHLASHGYSLVAVDFPLTSYKAFGPLKASDVVNQPGDLSFVIDQLLARNNEPTDPLFGTIDPQRIAALGYSLGGLTTLLIAFHGELGDPRIKIAAAIAAPSGMLTRQFFEQRKLPFLMVATPTDAMVDYRENAAGIPRKIAGSLLATIGNGSHAGFNYMARPLRFMKNPDQLSCWSLAFVFH